MGFRGVFFAIPLATLVQAIIRAWARNRKMKSASPTSRIRESPYNRPDDGSKAGKSMGVLTSMSDKKYPSVREMSGFQQVQYVRDIFSSITGRYDLLNHLLSLRRDIAWRRFCVGKMHLPKTNRFLDVATGTGDLAIEAARRYPRIRVMGLDFVGEMLDRGKEKAAERNLSKRVRFLRGDALDMPFRDDSFDAAAAAFGMRNIPEKIQALQEMKRVVVPGGQVMILEFTFPRTRLIRSAYSFYLKVVPPLLARRISENPGAYAYLADSIMHFPSPEVFKGLMKEAGLMKITAYSLTLGITWLYVGYKPEETKRPADP